MPSKDKKYDCVVIGSGPGGAPFAWKLASSGMKVLVLEAGARYNPLKDYALADLDWESKGFPYRKKIRVAYGETQNLDSQYEKLKSWNMGSGVINKTNQRRYLSYQQVPGVGGTTLHYQGEAHRLNEKAFRMNTLFGVTVDWPIEYEDLEPYYTKVENIIGVAGPDNVPFRPRTKPYPLKAHKLSYATKVLNKGCNKLGINIEPNTLAILSEVYRDAPPCNYCNGCVWGCPRKDKGSVDVTFVPLAEDTGNCEILTFAYAEKIEVDKKTGKVKGVTYFDRAKKEHFVEADYVAVACGAVETPRLLLNSELNGSGIVGKNFMETNFYEAVAFHPERTDSYRGVPIDGVIWDWNDPDPKRGFPGGLRIFPTVSSAIGPLNYALRYYENGWGEGLASGMKNTFGHAVAVGGISEFLPNENTFVSIESEKKDEFGFPMAKIQSFLGESELKSLDFIQKKVKEIFESSGAGEIVEQMSSYDLFAATHVFGTCRMGNDPESSVVDSTLRYHGIPNLLVTDASVFPTSGGGEAPSLTIEALSLRAAELLLEDLKKG